MSTHAKLFRGLADPARLSLLLRLRGGPCSAGVLADACDLSASNASNHLQCLLECGLVLVEARGRYNLYRIATAEVRRLLDASLRILASRAGAMIADCRNYQGLSRRALRCSDCGPLRGVRVVGPVTKKGSVRRTRG